MTEGSEPDAVHGAGGGVRGLSSANKRGASNAEVSNIGSTLIPMNKQHAWRRTALKLLTVSAVALLIAIGARQVLGRNAADAAGFPEGYDAVTAAPDSHRVIFENDLVRVLEVTMPPPGKTEPMHHHHWPGFFLDWDTGGKSPHIRYHQPGNIVRDVPSVDAPVHPGHWSVHWMKAESMHAIETVETFYSADDLPSVRVEIKIPLIAR